MKDLNIPHGAMRGPPKTLHDTMKGPPKSTYGTMKDPQRAHMAP